MDNVIKIFAENFSSCIWLAVILLAMIPTLESKIAIPFAMNTSLWGGTALPPWQALLFGFVGSILPSILIMFLARKIKRHTTGFLTGVLKSRYSVKSTLLEKQESTFKKYLFLTTFVALPLPLTGIWAGSFIAGLSNLKLHWSLLSIAIGGFISCSIVTLLCTVLSNSIGYILIFSIAIVVVFLTIDLSISLIKAINRKLINRKKQV